MKKPAQLVNTHLVTLFLHEKSGMMVTSNRS